MKKYILAASCAILSTTAVMAQTSSENDNAGSVSNTSTLTLSLDNVITMSESQTGMSATFNTAAKYNSGLSLSGGGASVLNPVSLKNVFTVQSNRYFNVQVSGTNFTATNTVAGENGNDNTVMDLNDEGGALVNCAVTDDGSHPSQGTPTSVNLSTSNQTILSNGHNGGDQAFDLAFFANPGWNYAGGTYTSVVTVTATQE